ncbi:MAG: KEOPS complex subunit Cgi121 [Methanomicrobiales archaeon]|nr:KEOPS complex subunit Cgi121 [Methanomicrobiales archaeon]
MVEYRILQATFTVDDIGTFIDQIRGIGLYNQCSIICFNADRVAGLDHVEAALVRALRARSSRERISRSLEMEALLYASGSRQCAVGAEFGVHAGYNRAFVAIVPQQEEAYDALSGCMEIVCADWDAIDAVKKKVLMDLFGITDAEIEAAGEDQIRALILERMALLEVNR